MRKRELIAIEKISISILYLSNFWLLLIKEKFQYNKGNYKLFYGHNHEKSMFHLIFYFKVTSNIHQIVLQTITTYLFSQTRNFSGILLYHIKKYHVFLVHFSMEIE